MPCCVGGQNFVWTQPLVAQSLSFSIELATLHDDPHVFSVRERESGCVALREQQFDVHFHRSLNGPF